MKWSEDLVKDIQNWNTFSMILMVEFHIQEDMGTLLMQNGNVVYPKEVTDCNRLALMQNFMTVRDNCNAILEIGIGRNRCKNHFAMFSSIARNQNVSMLDLIFEDRSFLNNEAPNVHTFMDDSSNLRC